MEAGRGAGLVKLLVFLSLCYVISGSNAGKQGCLFVDITDIPDCLSLPVDQKQCPSINYKVVDFPSNPVLIKSSLVRVKLIQNMLNLNLFSNAIKATKECKQAVRNYTCSNMFGECIEVASSVMVNYKFKETKKACDKVKSVCPQSIQDNTIYNCTNIMSNPLEFLQCASLPHVVGDVCPKTNYKYPLPSVREYPGLAKTSKNVFAQMQRTAGNMSLACAQKIMNVTCQLNAGPICSNDGMLRMYAMCKQDCEGIMLQCLPGQRLFKQLCKLFPDKKTAKKVAIPT